MKRLTQKNYLINGESEAYVYGGIENYGDSYGGEVIDKLAEYEDLEEQGLLLKLPVPDSFTDDLLNMGYTKGYHKAIDEFAENIGLEISESIVWDMLATMSKNSSLSDTSDEIVDYVINTANEIAERLKVGGENG